MGRVGARRHIVVLQNGRYRNGYLHRSIFAALHGLFLEDLSFLPPKGLVCGLGALSDAAKQCVDV